MIWLSCKTQPWEQPPSWTHYEPFILQFHDQPFLLPSLWHNYNISLSHQSSSTKPTTKPLLTQCHQVCCWTPAPLNQIMYNLSTTLPSQKLMTSPCLLWSPADCSGLVHRNCDDFLLKHNHENHHLLGLIMNHLFCNFIINHFYWHHFDTTTTYHSHINHPTTQPTTKPGLTQCHQVFFWTPAPLNQIMYNFLRLCHHTNHEFSMLSLKPSCLLWPCP